jgi:hypothetical protein
MTDAKQMYNKIHHMWMSLMSDNNISDGDVIDEFDRFMDNLQEEVTWKQCSMCERPYPVENKQ